MRSMSRVFPRVDYDTLYHIVFFYFMKMSKIDLSKDFKDAYTAKKTSKLVSVSVGSFLAIDGKGDPNGEEYARRRIK